MVRKINNINRLILPKQHYSSIALIKSILKPLNPNSIVNFRSRDVTYVTAIYRRKTKFLSKLQHTDNTLLAVFYSNMAAEIAKFPL